VPTAAAAAAVLPTAVALLTCCPLPPLHCRQAAAAAATTAAVMLPLRLPCYCRRHSITAALLPRCPLPLPCCRAATAIAVPLLPLPAYNDNKIDIRGGAEVKRFFHIIVHTLDAKIYVKFMSGHKITQCGGGR
jgi:hypothetical protein